MVERRPILTVFTHIVLILGVLVIAFPLYLTFVASTHTTQEIMQAPMPLLPGSHFFSKLHGCLERNRSRRRFQAPVARMMMVSLIQR